MSYEILTMTIIVAIAIRSSVESSNATQRPDFEVKGKDPSRRLIRHRRQGIIIMLVLVHAIRRNKDSNREVRYVWAYFDVGMVK